MIAADASMYGANMSSAASRYSAEQHAAASRYAADQAAAASRYGSMIHGQAAAYSADRSYEASQYSTDTNRYLKENFSDSPFGLLNQYAQAFSRGLSGHRFNPVEDFGAKIRKSFFK